MSTGGSQDRARSARSAVSVVLRAAAGSTGVRVGAAFLGFFVTTIAVPAVLMLGYWLVLQLVSGLGTLGAQGGGVAFWAHAGGFVGGAVLVLLFRNPRLLARHPYHGWRAKAPPGPVWRRTR